MTNDDLQPDDEPQIPAARRLDRTVLLVFISMLGLLFLLLNRVADGFLPDARLYPFVMTVAGLILAVLAFVRVWLGKEPIFDLTSGRSGDQSAEETIAHYRSAGAYLAFFSAFYLGVWLLGFRLAALVFVFGYMRYSGQSNLSAVIFAGAGAALVEVLSRMLQLYLPTGQWHLLGLG